MLELSPSDVGSIIMSLSVRVISLWRRVHYYESLVLESSPSDVGSIIMSLSVRVVSL